MKPRLSSRPRESISEKVTITSTWACARLVLYEGIQPELLPSVRVCVHVSPCVHGLSHQRVSCLRFIICQRFEAPASGGNGVRSNVKHVEVITAEGSSDRVTERRVSASFTHPILFIRTSPLHYKYIYLVRGWVVLSGSAVCLMLNNEGPRCEESVQSEIRFTGLKGECWRSLRFYGGQLKASLCPPKSVVQVKSFHELRQGGLMLVTLCIWRADVHRWKCICICAGLVRSCCSWWANC